MADRKQQILLHVCCGPCGTESVRRLQELGEVTLFFSNSNIFPSEEFDRRLFEVRRLASFTGCSLVVDPYCHAEWRSAVAGLETEPEGGARCRICFEFSLRRALMYAEENGFDSFTTSLTISRYKNSAVILGIGTGLGERFLAVDLKKQDGFRKSVELSREYGMYRQKYCGCEFSLHDLEGESGNVNE